MSKDDRKLPADSDSTPVEPGVAQERATLEALEPLSDEDLEHVAGGWTGDGDGSGEDD